MTNYNAIVKYLSYLPIGWFAGIVSLAVRNMNRLGFQRDLLLTVVALGSTLILILIPLRSIAKTYSAYLAFLLEGTNKSKKKLRIRKSIPVQIFLKFLKVMQVSAYVQFTCGVIKK